VRDDPHAVRLVADVPDGFTLIGDGQQSIYPGGYTLSEAGINLAGRGVVLDVNYRNTAQILDFASRMVAGDEYADIEGAVARGDAARAVARTGPEPVVARSRAGTSGTGSSWIGRDGAPGGRHPTRRHRRAVYHPCWRAAGS
jgi:hypothetical protein